MSRECVGKGWEIALPSTEIHKWKGAKLHPANTQKKQKVAPSNPVERQEHRQTNPLRAVCRCVVERLRVGHPKVQKRVMEMLESTILTWIFEMWSNDVKRFSNVSPPNSH